LALSNMGGYDAQTVAGVRHLDPRLRDHLRADRRLVRSLDLVISDGQWSARRADGPTDAACFAAHPTDRSSRTTTRSMRRSSAWCLGIVYGVTLRRRACLLPEGGTDDHDVDASAPTSSTARCCSTAHYELLVNPYPRGGHHA
jgi:hypothetical protein